MRVTQWEMEAYGNDVQLVSQLKEQTVYRIAGKDGEMVLTSYPVFSGINLVYHDAHTVHCTVDYTEPANILEITHCREGRMECAFGDQLFYLTPGDLVIRQKALESHTYFFPQNHYHGTSILVDLERTPRCLSCFLEDVEVTPSSLQKKYCREAIPFIVRSTPCVEHIFSELYAVPEAIQKGYFKVKVLELMLFLSGMRLEENETQKRCLPLGQVALAKEVAAYLTERMDGRVTIAQLAERFHVSQTAVKTCFKRVYGVSVYAYLRKQKMGMAALLLKQTDCSVLEIAGRCGYDNASKFAGAFRDIYGATPVAYRLREKDAEFTAT